MRRGIAILALLSLSAARVVAQPVHASDAGMDDAGSSDGGIGDPPEPPLPPEHRPRVSLRLEPGNTIPNGSVVRLHLTVSAAPGDDVTIPSQSFTPLELHSRRVTERVVGGRTESHFILELLALAPGDATLAPISLRVLTADGLVGTATTESIALHVTSVIANEPNAAPHGPTRPRELLEEWKQPLYIIASIAMMIVGGIVALLIRRWLARRPKPVVPPPPPRPAWEIAFEKLQALHRDGPAMIEEGRVGPWIDALSDTIREYLGRRYGFDGLECTSDEVVARVAALRLHGSVSTEITVFLGECDLVKFAQASMTVEQAATMFRQAQRIVTMSIPGGGGFGAVGGIS